MTIDKFIGGRLMADFKKLISESLKSEIEDLTLEEIAHGFWTNLNKVSSF